jgi:hypothetical protein
MIDIEEIIKFSTTSISMNHVSFLDLFVPRPIERDFECAEDCFVGF